MTGKGSVAAFGLLALGVAAAVAVALTFPVRSPGVRGYEIAARFDNVGGLELHAPVTLSGVRIGRVSDIEYEPERYVALVKMVIDSKYDRIPVDSGASIYTFGLLGERYVELDAGGADRFMQAGDEIALTQSALILEQLVWQFIFGRGSSQGGF